MLTKNFYAIMRLLQTDRYCTFISNTGAACDGGLWASATYGHPLAVLNKYYSSTTGGVAFGSGNTKATVGDYSLESQIKSGISVSTQSAVACSLTDQYEEYSAVFAVTATTDTTISEIGLFGMCRSTTNQSMVFSYLADRTVLETPITIKAGESKQITYTIRFNYPASA